jgi:hypothetical protein
MDRRPIFLASLVCSSMTSAIQSRPLAERRRMTGEDALSEVSPWVDGTGWS